MVSKIKLLSVLYLEFKMETGNYFLNKVLLPGTAISNAQQCLLAKEAVWLRERPVFESSNEPRIEILNCHQSLLHGNYQFTSS